MSSLITRQSTSNLRKCLKEKNISSLSGSILYTLHQTCITFTIDLQLAISMPFFALHCVAIGTFPSFTNNKHLRIKLQASLLRPTKPIFAIFLSYCRMITTVHWLTLRGCLLSCAAHGSPKNSYFDSFHSHIWVLGILEFESSHL